MLKIFAAIGLGSALMLAPALAFADESTTPPKADTVKTPGNGPDVKAMKHKMPMKHHMKSMKPMKPMAKKPMTDQPK